MASTPNAAELHTMSVPGRAVSDVVPTDLEFCCPKCGGFIAALELPTHRMDQNVVVHLRFHCKRCRQRSRRRVTLEAGPGR